MKLLGLLEFADLFSQPVRWKTLRHGGIISSYFGTIGGFVLTVVLLTIWFSYFGYLWVEMKEHRLDGISSQESYNEFDKMNELKMKDYSFLPSVEMVPLSNTLDFWERFKLMMFDIFDESIMETEKRNEEPNINIAKLSKYIKFTLDIRDQ